MFYQNPSVPITPGFFASRFSFGSFFFPVPRPACNNTSPLPYGLFCRTLSGLFTICHHCSPKSQTLTLLPSLNRRPRIHPHHGHIFFPPTVCVEPVYAPGVTMGPLPNYSSSFSLSDPLQHPNSRTLSLRYHYYRPRGTGLWDGHGAMLQRTGTHQCNKGTWRGAGVCYFDPESQVYSRLQLRIPLLSTRLLKNCDRKRKEKEKRESSSSHPKMDFLIRHIGGPWMVTAPTSALWIV